MINYFIFGFFIGILFVFIYNYFVFYIMDKYDEENFANNQLFLLIVLIISFLIIMVKIFKILFYN